MNKKIGLSLLTGVLFAFALPPFKTGFLAYAALIPLFLLLENMRSGEAFRWGYITGLFMAIFSLFWIGWVTMPGLFGMLFAWPLYIALFALLHTFLIRQFSMFGYALAPLMWVTIEYLQSLSELAFPWNYMGYTQSYYLPLIQYAEITSVYGVSFWVVLINVLFFSLYKYWKKERKVSILASIALVALFVGPLIFGFHALSHEKIDVGSKSIKISLIQGNRDPNAKWDGNIYEDNFSIYENLSKQVIAQQPDLIIWPETALPFYLRSKIDYIQRIRALVDSSNSSLLTGIMDFVYFTDGTYDHFNSAMLFEPNSLKTQAYAKMKLVPFSERVPYKKYFPFNVLKNVLWDLGIGDFGVGDEMTAFSLSSRYELDQSLAEDNQQQSIDYKTGTAICYESVFPAHVRKYVNAGANFLIIITNDAWFGKTSAPFQHTQIAVFRAIENRRAIARCANTGISCFIDKYGRVRKSTQIFTESTVTDDIWLSSQNTFYTQNGNIFVIFIAISSFLFLFIAVIKRIML